MVYLYSLLSTVLEEVKGILFSKLTITMSEFPPTLVPTIVPFSSHRPCIPPWYETLSPMLNILVCVSISLSYLCLNRPYGSVVLIGFYHQSILEIILNNPPQSWGILKGEYNLSSIHFFSLHAL